MSLDKQARIKITASAELGELQKLNDSINKMGEGFMKATVGATSMGGALANLASSIGTRLVSVLADAGQKLVAFVNAGDDFNDTVGANRDSVWKMAEAAQHMGSAMDVARFRSKLMASEGLKPTEQQLESLTRAATNLAAKQKTDWTSAADTLSNAWQGMGVRALKPLNIEIDQSGSLLEKQRQILEGVAQLGPAVLSQAAKEKALIKAKDDAWLHLSSTMNDNGAVSALMHFNQVTRLQNEIAYVKSLELGYQRVRNAILGSGLAGKIASASGLGAGMDAMRILAAQEQIDATAQAAMGMAPAGLQGVEVMGFFKGGKKKQSVGRSGGSRDMSSPFGIREWIYDQLARFDEEEFELARKRKEKFEALLREQRQGDVEAEGEGQRARLGEEFKSFARRSGAEKKMRDMEGTAGARIAGADAAAEAMRGAEAFATYSAMVAKTNGELQSLATTGINQAFTGMMSLADAAISGEENVGKMAINMLKSTAMGLSQQLFAMGVAASFEAAALTAGVYTAPFAAAASAKASVYFAGAAALGGMGLGLSALGAAAGGGAKPASTGGRAASGGGDFRPSFGSKQSSKDLPPIIVRVTFDRSDPAAEQFARRQVRAQLLRAGGYGAD